MQENIHIVGVQANLAWENVEANIAHFSSLILSIQQGADIIVLPEMFATGFSMNTAFAKESGEKGLAALKQWAVNKNAAIVGSLMIEENDQFFNRMYFVLPSGEFFQYDKKHLFTLAKEEDYFAAGNEQVIVTYKGWKIALQICYDLRFPVWNRRNSSYDYDLLINVASWPERRSHAWKSLLVARAIENQTYLVGVNRVGKDASNIDYSGDSVILNPFGQAVASARVFKEDIIQATLSWEKLQKTRRVFAFAKDADSFEIK